MADSIDNASKAFSTLADTMKSSHEALDGLNKAILEGGQGFNGIINQVETFSKGLGNVSIMMGQVIGMIPLMGPLAGVFGDAGGMVNKFLTGLGDTVKAYGDLVGTVDAVSGVHRKLDKDLFALGATFGQTFGEAKNVTDAYLKTAKEVGTAQFGFVRPEQLTAAAESAKGLGLGMKFLADETGSADSAWMRLAVSVRHAQALGIETTQYMSLLNNAIMVQGMNSQEAAEQMAMFKDIASTTGLSVDRIASGLQGASSQFAKFGMQADLGRPLLEGFTRTLDSMGLGIGQATDLTTSLSTAFGSLATNYGLAAVTAQRGGLNFAMGGGALNAGIQMQAQMLQGGDQADLGKQLAGAMRDTLASFTGGQIVTVQEAAQSPELQTAFYAQTQMLQNMYSLDAGTATRTLDLLAQLDEATRSGDTELADSLTEQISDATVAQNATVDATERLETVARAQLLGIMEQNRWLADITRSLATSIGGVGEEQLESFAAVAQEELFRSNRSSLESMIGNLLDDEMTDEDKRGKIDSAIREYQDRLENTKPSGQEDSFLSGLSSGKEIGGGDSNFFSDFKSTINGLDKVFDNLIMNLEKIMPSVGTDVRASGMMPGDMDDARRTIMNIEDRNRRETQMMARAENAASATGPGAKNELEVTVTLEPGPGLEGLINPVKQQRAPAPLNLPGNASRGNQSINSSNDY